MVKKRNSSTNASSNCRGERGYSGHDKARAKFARNRSPENDDWSDGNVREGKGSGLAVRDRQVSAKSRHSRQLTNRGLAFRNSHHQERVSDGAPPPHASTTIS